VLAPLPPIWFILAFVVVLVMAIIGIVAVFLSAPKRINRWADKSADEIDPSGLDSPGIGNPAAFATSTESPHHHASHGHAGGSVDSGGPSAGGFDSGGRHHH